MSNPSPTQLQFDLSHEPVKAEIPKTVPVKLRVENLSHRYGDKEVLKSISFKIREGEALGILGPNGAGKTTLFQILSGLLPSQTGDFFLNGAPYRPSNPQGRERLGIVFQNPSLDQKLRAEENLLLSAALYRIGKKEARERVAQLLRFMELEDRRKDLVQKFSGGMKRRLEIIRALIHGPEFLILDEPTTGLDESGFQKIWQRLLHLKANSKFTMLLTTHRADEAEKCDRLLILDKGVIIAEDTPANLKSSLGGDILEMECGKPTEIQRILNRLKADFDLKAELQAKNRIRVLASKGNGHELIPKIVEGFEPQTFNSINLHHPSIADVFLHLTGNLLYGASEDEAGGEQKK